MSYIDYEKLQFNYKNYKRGKNVMGINHLYKNTYKLYIIHITVTYKSLLVIDLI